MTETIEQLREQTAQYQITYELSDTGKHAAYVETLPGLGVWGYDTHEECEHSIRTGILLHTDPTC